MTFLVDTSVWSLALRRDTQGMAPEVIFLKEVLLGAGVVVTTGLILQELLQGFAGPKAAAQIVERFAALPLMQADREDHIAAAELRNSCRRAGVQVGTIDALLAQICIRYDLVLLSTDKDFVHMSKHCALRVWGLPADNQTSTSAGLAARLDSTSAGLAARPESPSIEQTNIDELKLPNVVAIGASAGGLAAFKELIENLPTDTGMAFVLLSHILRGAKSLLPEILSRSTKMPVVQVTQMNQTILADHIYILPPDKFMEIDGDSLILIPRPDKPVNSAIDHFLFSLAKDQARSSIGIILSGEGSDGAEGLKILKEKGGVTIAQTPASAASKSMPINAIEIDHVDHILSPKEIARQLGSIAWRESNITQNPFKVFWMNDQV